MPYRKDFKYRELIRSGDMNVNFDFILSMRKKVDLTAQIDNIIDVFLTPDYFFANTIEIYVDGILQRETLDYVVLADNTFKIPINPSDAKLQIGQDLIVCYFKKP